MDSSTSLDLLISDPKTKLTQMTTEQKQLMDPELDDLNDINVTSLVGYRDSLLQKQQIPIQSNEQNINTSNISLTKSSSSSFWQLKIPVTKSTQNEQQKHVNQVIELINKSTTHSSVNCSECDKSFINTGSLAYHLWKDHCKEEQMYHSTQFTPNQSNINQPKQIFEFSKFQQNSSFTTTINDKGITSNINMQLENQHQEKPMTSKKKVIKKSFYKCEWDFCERLFVGLEDLKTHVLNVHVDGFDVEDGEDSGEVLVETLKKDEQSIKQVNLINHNETTLDEINENEQSMAISHDHESTNAKSSQQLLVDSDSSKESMDEMVLEDDTNLDKQSIDHFDSTDSDAEQLHQSEHPLPELNKSTAESKSMNQNETILKPYRCFYCDDAFEMVDCLRKHFEAFHAINSEEESETDSDDYSLGEIDSVEIESEKTDLDTTGSDEESSEETDLNNADLDEHSKNEVGSDGTDYDEKSSEKAVSEEEDLYPEQFETQQQELLKLSNINNKDCVDYLEAIQTDDYGDSNHCVFQDGDGEIEAINDNQQLQCAIIDNGPNIDGHLQQQLVHRVMKLNESTNRSLLNCPECGKSFKNEHSVRLHLQKVHPKQMFYCGVSGCGKWCKTIIHMMSHYQLSKAHKKVNIPCDQCKMFGINKNFQAHLETHHFICFDPQQPDQVTELNESTNQSSFNCPECGKSFDNKHSVKMHLKQVHPKQMLKCGVSGCGQSFKTIYQLLAHYRHKKAHKKVNLPCDQCTMFKNRNDFMEHLQAHHFIYFESQQPIHQNIKSTNQSLFICPKCGKSLCDKHTLYMHLLVVHPKQMYKCDVSGCGKWCKTINRMLTHYRNKKTHKTANLPCDQCKKFVINIDFRVHLETHHQICFEPQQPTHQNIKSTNQSLFICLECGKSHCDTTTLNAHLKKIHPKQMFFCGVSGCCKWCKSISEMLSHYRHKKAHKKVNLPCDECKKFGKDRHLKAHLESDHSISFYPQQPNQ